MKFDSNHRLIWDPAYVQHPVFQDMLAEMKKVIVGYERELAMLCTLFTADGHALLMANSGLGKTKIATCLPLIVKGMKVARVQGTPDQLPSTVIGYTVDTADGQRVWRKGQVPGGEDGANLVVVDEATRFTPRVWAAFLQMLEERQKTVEDETQPMPEVFSAILTANFPAPGQGTVELPDATYDRLMFTLQWGYPTLEGLTEITRRADELRDRHPEKFIGPVTDLAEITRMREEVRAISRTASNEVCDYIARLTYGTNPHQAMMDAFTAPNGKPFKGLVALGGSPRCAMDLKIAAAAFAQLLGEKKLRPEHVKAVFPDVARAHTKMGEAANLGRNKVKVDDLIDAVLKSTQP
jgi:MoxR-like ATPase